MENNKYKRMAKNAGMLYIRMLLTMAVTLYTSRVVLQTLGVDDFGIYSVVAGFVTMLGFLNSAMSSATQRFLAFELGKSGDKDLRGIFSMSLNIHLLIAMFVLLLGETVGLWFVKTQLTIPADRLMAAQWVFHFALLSFMVTIISVPYNALIIAHERMSVFAWVSIIDVMLKLLIVFMLSWFGMDKLILYAVLSLAVVFIVFVIYRSYCKKYFVESRFQLYWDKQLFNTMLSYTGWNLWGNIAAVMSGQGVNILLNIFFGPSVNAARAIAMQVSGALNSFVQNLQVAINPQIIKSYAARDLVYMHRLVCYGAKYNFFLLLLLSLPILNNLEHILLVWLDVVPENTAIFAQLVIYTILIDSLSPPLMTAAQATGNIKLYQFVVGGILLINVPVSYMLLKMGGTPQTVFYVAIVLSLITLLARIQLISKLINMQKRKYLIDTLVPVVAVLALVFIVNSFIDSLFTSSFSAFLLSVMTSGFLVVTVVLAIGLKQSERMLLSRVFLNLKRKVWQ
ncbi:lipopolysaccharide biosynthesis protein [Thiopseudomonas alkaliphila]|uniref:lipopolysaccharide biosynthesis protein n=1 Tax=Thiopseudomonas alkaliphila TaxID=1697053 RepID=UPI0035710172